MGIHIRRTPVFAVVGVLALGAVSAAAAQDTAGAARQDTAGYQPSRTQTDTTHMGGNAARSDTSGYKYNGAPTDTALKAKPGVQTGPTAADSSRMGGGQDTSSSKQDTSGYKSSGGQADTSGRVNRTTRSGYKYHGAPTDTALKAEPGVQTGPAPGDTGRMHMRRHRMKMSAVDSVVCKDGQRAANSPSGACSSNGGVDTVATWHALKARGIYPARPSHRMSHDTSSNKSRSDTSSSKSSMSPDTSSSSNSRSSP
ncbi:MAG TPA: hypothetical protein VJQ46_02940 [Gemmatimonadales bacterium]|nr:hypothetical protein [Gemmatimonadales bacterium]